MLDRSQTTCRKMSGEHTCFGGKQFPSSRHSMKILFQSAMVFLGALVAAALVAWGEPGTAEVQMATQGTPAAEVVASALGLEP